MGSRAGFVVKRDAAAKAYGSRYAGSSTVDYLLLGPEKATDKFIAQDELEDVADVLGGEDGAAIIDWDHRVVIWMMANCSLPVHQRLCNRIIAQAFHGWTVRMAHDIYEISEQAGGDTSQYVSDDEHDPEKLKEELRASGASDEEIAEEIRSIEEDRKITAADVWSPPKVQEPITSLDEFDGVGSWVTVRRADGTLKNYFGFDYLDDYLLLCKAFAAALRDLPTIDQVPHEIVTTDGLFIDENEKVVWRWHLGRVQALEQRIKTAWQGWTFREVPGCDWTGQVKLSGREAAGRSCPERKILGLVVAEHAPYASGSADSPGLVGMLHAVRKGCLVVTAAAALAGVAAYGFTQSAVLVIAGTQGTSIQNGLQRCPLYPRPCIFSGLCCVSRGLSRRWVSPWSRAALAAIDFDQGTIEPLITIEGSAAGDTHLSRFSWIPILSSQPPFRYFYAENGCPRARPLQLGVLLAGQFDLAGWRQHEHLLRRVKKIARNIARISSRKGPHYQKRLKNSIENC